MMLIVLALLGLLLASVAMLVAGLRGRRVDDHPVCRRCGFDLVGAPAGSTACPECGADVTRHGAVRAGNRVRRGGLIAGGAVLMLLGAGPLAMVGLVGLRGVDLTQYKPASMIIREVGGPDATMRPALRELTRRLRAGGLSDAQVNALADRALAGQADRSRPWAPQWGQFLEAARDEGRLDQGRWDRYLDQSFVTAMVIRRRIRRGDPIPLSITGDLPRVGTKERFALSLDGPAPLVVAGETLSAGTPDARGRPPRRTRVVGMPAVTLVYPDPAALARVPDGEHLARAGVNVTIQDVGGAASHPPYRTSVQLDAKFTLLPADEPSVHPVTLAEGLLDRVRESVTAELVVPESGPARLDLRSRRSPVNDVFGVFLRGAGAADWPVATVVLGPDGEYVLTTNAPAGLLAGRVDVVLRSDPQASVESLYWSGIWPEDVLLEDVPVARLGTAPSPRPAAPVTRPANRR